MSLSQPEVAIIGMGTVGHAVLSSIREHHTVIGIDKGDTIPECDIYIICVYSCEEVIDVVSSLPEEALVIIESTISPETVRTLGEREFVYFPHRLNPSDSKHQVLNLNRVMGGSSGGSVDRALAFYQPLMIPPASISILPLNICVLSKLVENAYRYCEIAFAEELKLMVGDEFDELRYATNMKWNIDIKEARDGIRGKCLLKDIELLSREYPQFSFLRLALEVDSGYREAKKV